LGTIARETGVKKVNGWTSNAVCNIFQTDEMMITAPIFSCTVLRKKEIAQI
jgi:hypothetical protein